MSRIGQKPITIPEKVIVKISKDGLTVSGPLGEMTRKIEPQITVKVENGQIKVSRQTNSRQVRALHGTVRALLANMVAGVVSGFKKRLKLVGTGYRAKMEGANLHLLVGFSHPVLVKPVAGIKFAVQGSHEIIVSGLDKALVGQVAAQVRKIKKPDAYKGKGIRYRQEVIKLKPGKAAKIGAEGTGKEG